ncbi:MAG: FtsH protease activity modulator HflK [Candidatus Eisenbacteria bacterium]|uniref:Protein HflK n=1 Tax=Eiseniibacteriota bacterium TaxID=2212470 RepID=A0A937XB98_UNCEI|nr:FtsH protease activity modulator HflK [Candidatus Eisenbacteria bacterium]
MDDQDRREIDLGRLRELRVPSPGGGALRAGALALIALIAALTSFYTVDPEEVGLVMRFGAYTRTSEPGLHLKMPFGVERVLKVPIQRQLKQEFGFRTTRSGVHSEYSTRGLEGESNMLTGDLNAAVVEWVVQYRVLDPYKYLFRVRNVEETFRGMTEAVMRKIVGDRTVNEVLTVGRAEVATEVEVQLQALCAQYETGIKVDQVVLQDVNPPDPVKPSFNEVNKAQQEREKLINEAQSEYNKVVPRAQGQALQTIQEAEGYALDRVNRARGDAARFDALYTEYRRAPEVTRTRIYLETMNAVLPQIERKVVVDDRLTNLLPLLNLDAAGAKRGIDP